MYRSRDENSTSRAWGWALLALLVLLPACASNTPPPATTPTRPAVEPAALPAPPAGASSAVEAAWLDLRAGVAAATVPEGSAEGRALEGFEALREGRIQAASTAFQAALETRPGFAHAEYGLGLVTLLQERRDLARQWFSSALTHDPTMARAAVRLRALALEDVEGALLRAESAERDGDVVAAAGHYREALDGAPDIAALYLRLAATATDEQEALGILERGRVRAGDDAALLAELGRRYRSAERFEDAYEVYRTLSDLRPDDDELAAIAEEARREYEAASLPPEYRQLPDRESITREELAAILAIHLEGLRPPEGRPGVFVSDVEERWSAPFIQRMVEWGVMDVYQNNAFWPDLEVPRSMLVEAAYRALEIMGVAEMAPRPDIDDPPREHLLYRPVQALVGLEVIQPRASGSFELLEPVSGAEAIRVAERLAGAIRRLRG